MEEEREMGWWNVLCRDKIGNKTIGRLRYEGEDRDSGGYMFLAWLSGWSNALYIHTYFSSRPVLAHWDSGEEGTGCGMR